MISGLPDESDLRSVITSAFDQWAFGAEVILEPISPGYSGASLFKVDVKHADGARLPSGQYILKLSTFSSWQDMRPEFDAHILAFKRDPDFSATHIPRIVDHYAADPAHTAGSAYAMLFDIAGGSLDRYAATDTRQDGRFQVCASSILAALLEHWADPDVAERKTASELLEELCGYRLTPSHAASLHQLVAERIPDIHFVVGDHVLVNPLRFYELSKEERFGSISVLRGLSHGDLHGGNILLNLMRPTESPFYIIDFALAREWPVGYDAAYLELAHALGAVGDQDPTILIGALNAAEEGDATIPIAGDAHWTRDLVIQLRATIEDWRARKHPLRSDQIDRQLALCRIAAGINWANKPIKDSWRQAALYYAGWSARQYLRTHEPKIWASLNAPVGKRPHAGSKDDEELWTEIWSATKGFDATQAKFILVAEGHTGTSLKALGQLPWSAVLDLDPRSDESGLHFYASPNLNARRGVHTFSTVIPTVDPRRGTGWMMTGGWAAKKEYFPDYHEWRWERVNIARDYLRRLAEATSPDPLHVIILPGATLDPTMPGTRIGMIVTAIDEASRGRAKIHLLGSRTISETARGLSRVPMESLEFIRRIEKTFGTGFAGRVAEVPGADGQSRAIPISVLRAMEENFHVLHSSILDDNSSPLGPDAAFWRGRPPTWAELHAGMDIERSIHPVLIRELAEKLEAHRNQTLILQHAPGAGGTTAALRAAWDLKNRHPVAVLHKYTPALRDRLRELFQIAEQPILLVAEAADLTESAREDLYRYLSRNNCRVVLLYLRRNLSIDDADGIRIDAPMMVPEARKFLGTYSSFAVSDIQRKQLSQITSRNALSRYRIPFFYGLITFENEFAGIDRFVHSHLANVGKSVRDILERLALVTIYSNSGLPLSLLKAMLDIDPNSDLPLDDVLGPEPAGLLVERADGVRFMHWTIAEKTLTHFRGSGSGSDDDWRFDLKAYAVDLIRSAVAAAGPEAMRNLFRQIFIDRIGSPDETDDREQFSPIIENLDSIDKTLGHAVLEILAENCPDESHFWAHLGRHQVYRMRQDYDKAEEFLRRAIDLNPRDPLHHHTFGLVLRSQLRHRLKGLGRDAGVDEIFAQMSPLFDLATQEFAETRDLSPDNVYGYITHIQMIVWAARELKTAAAVKTIAKVGIGSTELDIWLSENLASAENLLREASHLYATLDRSDDYLTSCQADLDSLYGDLDAVVELWEVANASGLGGAHRRRALSNAYLARRDRRWSNLCEPELRRIVVLMGYNLRESGRRDDDYELWFNAYLLLPEFDVDEALSQLAIWAKKFPSWRAYYYAYVLHFLLWFDRRTDDLNSFEVALEQCKKRHIGRRSYSPLWYGISAGRFGLISESELGRWRKDLGFFPNVQPLRRVNGMIDVISGPQAGSIKIGGRVQTFFVPGRTFSANRSENDPVHFFLGFSPSGPRAWSVQEGRDGVERPQDDEAPAGSFAVPVPELELFPAAKRTRVSGMKRERGLAFLRDLVAAKARVGASISVADLEQHLDALFGVTGSAKLFGMTEISKLLNGGEGAQSKSVSGEPENNRSARAKSDTTLYGTVKHYDYNRKFGFIVGENGRKYWFSREFVLPRDRGDLTIRWLLVRFVPSANERGDLARGVSILRTGVFTPYGFVEDAEGAASISRFALAEASANPMGIELGELTSRIEKKFWATGGIRRCIGDQTVAQFINECVDLQVVNSGGTSIVKLVEDATFGPPAVHPPMPEKTTKHKGQEEPSSKNAGKSSARQVSKSELKTAIKEIVEINLSNERSLTTAALGNILREKYPGEDRVYVRVGYKTLGKMLADIAGISVGPPPENVITIVKTLARRKRPRKV